MKASTSRVTRRELLVGTSRLALLTVMPIAPALAAGQTHPPWSDDTFFSDGTGWADGGSLAAARSS